MCWLNRVGVLQITTAEGSLHDSFRENSLSCIEYGSLSSMPWEKEDSSSPQINSLAIMRLQIPSIPTATVHSVSLVMYPSTNHAKRSIAVGRGQTSVISVCCVQINLSMKYIMQIIFMHVISLFVTFLHLGLSCLMETWEKHHAIVKRVLGLICNQTLGWIFLCTLFGNVVQSPFKFVGPHCWPFSWKWYSLVQLRSGFISWRDQSF